MRQVRGVIQRILLGSDGVRQTLIACDSSVTPKPGQYIAATSLAEPDASLASVLYPVRTPTDHGMLQVGPAPQSWKIGDQLLVSGPIGKGFDLQRNHHRLGLISLSGSAEWLMPGMQELLLSDNQVTFIGDANLSSLPIAVEAYPLESWQEHLSWVDELLVECSIDDIPSLRQIFRINDDFKFPVPVQLLVFSVMPCLGLADCAVCALRSVDGGYLLLCSDGPVIDLQAIDW